VTDLRRLEAEASERLINGPVIRVEDGALVDGTLADELEVGNRALATAVQMGAITERFARGGRAMFRGIADVGRAPEVRELEKRIDELEREVSRLEREGEIAEERAHGALTVSVAVRQSLRRADR
jgi:hypothetical protein